MRDAVHSPSWNQVKIAWLPGSDWRRRRPKEGKWTSLALAVVAAAKTTAAIAALRERDSIFAAESKDKRINTLLVVVLMSLGRIGEHPNVGGG